MPSNSSKQLRYCFSGAYNSLSNHHSPGVCFRINKILLQGTTTLKILVRIANESFPMCWDLAETRLRGNFLSGYCYVNIDTYFTGCFIN